MKKIVLIPALLLAACAQMTNNDQQDGFFYEDEISFEQDEYNEEIMADDTVFVDENSGLTAETSVNESLSVEQVNGQKEITVSDDGTVITIPAQKIIIDGGLNVVLDPVEIKQQPEMMAYSKPQQVEVTPNPVPQPKTVWITLQNKQHPNTFVQCMSSDMACVQAHEQQGYVRVQNLPQFAGYQDVLGLSDYPGEGQWRNGNNIPRW